VCVWIEQKRKYSIKHGYDNLPIRSISMIITTTSVSLSPFYY